jgi:hypothetical protein
MQENYYKRNEHNEHKLITFPVLGYAFIVSLGIVRGEIVNIICALFSWQINFTQQKNRRNSWEYTFSLIPAVDCLEFVPSASGLEQTFY